MKNVVGKVAEKVLFISAIIVIVISLGAFVNSVFANSESNKNSYLILTETKYSQLELTTFIYDKDGEEIATLSGEQDRILVDYEDLPENLVNAIVAIEDERFFSHSGIDFKRTVAAIGNYIVTGGKSDFGGSTITQQLIKNLTEDNEKTVTRKIREWVRALALEAKLSKEDILEAYVNTIYMGEGSYGIEVAANNYFAKSAKDLNLAESAVLAAAIQSPEGTNPYASDEKKQKLLERQKLVLQKMLELNYITQNEYDEACNQELTFKKLNLNNEVQIYFVDAVIEQLTEDMMQKEEITYDQAKKKIYTSGYKIYTTYDPEVQKAIDKAYSNKNIFYTDYNGNFMQSAMVVMDHTNGNVLGISGGAGKKTGNFVFNRATQSYRQPGSCMKVFGAYGPAIEKGIISTPSQGTDDSPLTIGDWSPKNYYNYFNGYVSIREAIAKSMNLPAVRTSQKVGIDYAYNFAKSCGLESLQEEDKSLAPLSLGGLTKGVTVLEMANAYSTIANGGMYNDPKFYSKVLDRNGNEYIIKTYTETRVMKESTAYLLTSSLQSVTQSGGTAYGYVSVPNIQVAGKTGNTDNDYDQWFCGYTPYYTIACWNGYDTNKTINRAYPYASVRLFNTVMNNICNGKASAKFTAPSTVKKMEVCKLSGLLPNDACYNDGRGSKVVIDYVSTDNIPTTSCDVHKYVEVCSNSGLLKSADCSSTYKKSCIVKDYSVSNDTSDSYYSAPTSICTSCSFKIDNILEYFDTDEEESSNEENIIDDFDIVEKYDYFNKDTFLDDIIEKYNERNKDKNKNQNYQANE